MAQEGGGWEGLGGGGGGGVPPCTAHLSIMLKLSKSWPVGNLQFLRAMTEFTSQILNLLANLSAGRQPGFSMKSLAHLNYTGKNVLNPVFGCLRQNDGYLWCHKLTVQYKWVPIMLRSTSVWLNNYEGTW